MKAGNIARRGSPFSWPGLAALAAALLTVSCAVGPRTLASLPGPERPAERVGPYGTTIALYDRTLFGPERPLTQLIDENRLPLIEGKLKNASL
ncbi:MAG: hypothetical protein OEW05_03295, partial [Candidatus Aminicenantes bacterium]|nr:hypothetical protein [Candidatus Aminicenantes bacterium]